MTLRVPAAVAVVAAAAALASGCTAAPHPDVRNVRTRGTSVAPARSSAQPHPQPRPAAPPLGAASLAGVVRRPARRDHCAAHPAARFVLVSIAAQHAWLCARHRVALSTPITSGAARHAGDATPRGTFRVQGLDRNSVLSLSGRTYGVRFWIPFRAPLYGFHDASWQRIPFGSPRYLTRGSHGCVHLPLRAIRFLYRWARIGTRVRIR